MTKDNSSHGPVSRDASSQPTFVALFAVSLVAAAACSSASIQPGQFESGGGSGSGGVGGSGTTGGGGIIIDFDAHVPAADARGTGIDRPGGGTCGDGIIERSEQCDDGNTTNADGCSRLCQIEANWDCPDGGTALRLRGQLRQRPTDVEQGLRRRQYQVRRRLLRRLPDRRDRLYLPRARPGVLHALW